MSPSTARNGARKRGLSYTPTDSAPTLGLETDGFDSSATAPAKRSSSRKPKRSSSLSIIETLDPDTLVAVIDGPPMRWDEADAKDLMFHLVANCPTSWLMLHRDDPLFSLEFDRMRKNRHGLFDWLWDIPQDQLDLAIGYVRPDGTEVLENR